jgi:hypothetical protein
VYTYLTTCIKGWGGGDDDDIPSIEIVLFIPTRGVFKNLCMCCFVTKIYSRKQLRTHYSTCTVNNATIIVLKNFVYSVSHFEEYLIFNPIQYPYRIQTVNTKRSSNLAQPLRSYNISPSINPLKKTSQSSHI